MNYSTFACLHQGSCVCARARVHWGEWGWGNDQIIGAGWFHFKFTTINMEEYLTPPGRPTVFPIKSAFSLLELTSLHLFSLLKPVTSIFLPMPLSVEDLLHSIKEKFPHISLPCLHCFSPIKIEKAPLLLSKTNTLLGQWSPANQENL